MKKKEEVQPLKEKIKNRVMQGDVSLEQLVGMAEIRHNVTNAVRHLIDGKQENGDWRPFMSAYIVPIHGEKSRELPLDKEVWFTYAGEYEHPADIRRLAEKMRMKYTEKRSAAELTEGARVARREFVHLYITRGKITVERREELAREEAKRKAEQAVKKNIQELKRITEDKEMQSMIIPAMESAEKFNDEAAEKHYREFFESYPAYLKPTEKQLEEDAKNLATLLEANIPEIEGKIAYCLTYKENGMYPYFDRALIIRFT